ncbi:MAG: hypothetical protein GWO86_04065 [Planctomycetes bacterium]|nr:hypothetical protein [Planctomycetota bacterium]
MSKFSAGLHKDVSKIFDGVAIPKKNAAEAVVSQNHNRAAALSSGPRSGGRADSAGREKTPKNNIKKKSSSQTLSNIKSKFSEVFHSAGNPRQKVMAALVPLLLIVLIWVIGRAFGTTPIKTIKAGTFDPAPIAARPVKDKWQTPEKYPDDLRDPMQYSSDSSAPAQEQEQQNSYDKIVVRGIVYSDDSPTAIIGDEIVGVGDKVYGVTVLKINADSVEFQMDDNVWTQKVQD